MTGSLWLVVVLSIRRVPSVRLLLSMLVAPCAVIPATAVTLLSVEATLLSRVSRAVLVTGTLGTAGCRCDDVSVIGYVI